MNSNKTESRKARHVELVVRDRVEHRQKRTGLDDFEFIHSALPELRFNDISIDSALLRHPLGAPLVISSMTGGYAGALEINRVLGRAAERFGLAIGIGSGRQALESSEHHRTFSIVREVAPHAFIFANIGAVEVSKMHSRDAIGELNGLIEVTGANALAIHLNPLQELLQPEGSRDFRGVLAAIRACVTTLDIPIVIKEVGSGISQSVARELLEVGVRAIDVAGAGGTSWAGVEILRNDEATQQKLDPFWDWGIPTAESLCDVRTLKAGYEFDLVASGGLRTGVDIAKALALGADAAAIARPLIQATVDGGEDALFELIETFLFQLRAVMFLTGSSTIAELKRQPLRHRDRILELS